ncbi:putative quinol monooxygenase [Smaragdicoccus niigatensis]|uniref:putative quinol monooxygenase n=1 Tax=Smaragdicoccus niigatensis TaxID=359359 RepID=UPI0003828670|nr:putative quinol monooxygenase [Smaragdicoccus niigatensis]
MIFIVVKFPVKPEYADEWLTTVDEFTQATRQEDGNLWFEWSRSADDPTTYVLVEAFADGAAEAHVTSAHFQKALNVLRPLVRTTPSVVSTMIEGATGWSRLVELEVD